MSPLKMLHLFIFYSGIAAAPDFESSSYGTLLYFLEGVLPFLEAFYRDFYFPDSSAHPNELDETDHIAKAIVVNIGLNKCYVSKCKL